MGMHDLHQTNTNLPKKDIYIPIARRRYFQC